MKFSVMISLGDLDCLILMYQKFVLTGTNDGSKFRNEDKTNLHSILRKVKFEVKF